MQTKKKCYILLPLPDSTIQSGHFEPLGASVALKAMKSSKQQLCSIIWHSSMLIAIELDY